MNQLSQLKTFIIYARREAVDLAAEAQRAKKAASNLVAWGKWAGIGTVVLAVAFLACRLSPPITQQEVTIEKIGGIDYPMVRVTGGTYTMGSPTTEAGRGNDECQHSVTVATFSIGQTEVTQAQWQAVMGSNPSNFKGDNLPVENVSWDEVQVFIQKLNTMTGKNFRLPKEAEWEYTAREGGKNVRFGNGKDVANPKEMNFNGQEDYKQPYSTVGEYRESTTPIGSFPSNALGLYDMSGNVWEWCQDKYGPYSGCSEPESVTDFRVVRGGSWYSNDYVCRSADRNYIEPGGRYNVIGFRLAQD